MKVGCQKKVQHQRVAEHQGGDGGLTLPDFKKNLDNTFRHGTWLLDGPV